MEEKLIKVELQKLIYTHTDEQIVDGRPHAFAYHMRITNGSEETIELSARKWILKYDDARVEVFEGDGIVGKIVTLETGEFFEYSSYHLVDSECEVSGSYHGQSKSKEKIWVRIPKFHLHIPEKL